MCLREWSYWMGQPKDDFCVKRNTLTQGRLWKIGTLARIKSAFVRGSVWIGALLLKGLRRPCKTGNFLVLKKEGLNRCPAFKGIATEGQLLSFHQDDCSLNRCPAFKGIATSDLNLEFLRGITQVWIGALLLKGLRQITHKFPSLSFWTSLNRCPAFKGIATPFEGEWAHIWVRLNRCPAFKGIATVDAFEVGGDQVYKSESVPCF